MQRKVIELIRVSTARQAEDDRLSIPAQKSEIRKICNANGFTIAESIEYCDVSGSDVLETPEMQYLLQKCEDPSIVGIVAFSFSRLMRVEKGREMGLLDRLAELKKNIYLPNTTIELSSPMGRFIARLLASVAGLEKEELKAKMYSNKEERRKAGLCPSADICLPTGLGYDRERNKWFYTAEAEKIREAFRMVLAGETFRTISGKTGLNRTSVRELLKNPVWIGWRQYDKKRDQSDAGKVRGKGGRQGWRKKIAREANEVVRVRINVDAPLISEEEFARAQQIISARYDRAIRERADYRTGTDSKFVYHGFLSCSDCGAPIYTFTRSRDGVGYYVCKCRMQAKRLPDGMKPCRSSYMMAPKLEGVLDELFSKRLPDDGFVREMLQEQKRLASGSSNTATIKRLQAELAKLQTRRANVLQMFEDGDITRDEKLVRIEKIERDRKLAEELLAREKPTAPILSPEQVAELFAPLYEWETMGTTEKRRILGTIVPEIKVAEYKVHGFYALLPGCDGENGLALPAGSNSGIGSEIVDPYNGGLSRTSSRVATGRDSGGRARGDSLIATRRDSGVPAGMASRIAIARHGRDTGVLTGKAAIPTTTPPPR